MLNLEANGHAWRTCLCRALDTNHDYDEEKVRELFLAAADWAKSLKIDFDDETDHLTTYLTTRDQMDVDPVIPEHVRRFCAQKVGLPMEARPRHTRAVELPEIKERKERREPVHHRPSVAMRR